MIGAVLRAGLSIGSLVLAMPSVTFATECLLGVLREKGGPATKRGGQSRAAVLVPAHNESAGIAKTLGALIDQMGAQDQVFVIADNCTDDTAEKARLAGATVLERFDDVHRGKGFALSHAVAHLSALETAPDVVVVLDADCALSEGGLDALVAAATAHQRPVQADNVLRPPPVDSSVKTKIGVFAFRVKNLIRPRGLQRMGFGRQLAGTGMAFPWPILRDAPSMQGHITEDLVLGLELAIRGNVTIHCWQARVESDIAPTVAGQGSQRERWEKGHLSAIREYLPRLLYEGVRQRRLDLVALGFDLSVPALAILVLLIGGSCATTLVAAAIVPGVGWVPVAITVGEVLVVACGVTASWWRCGRDVLSIRELCFGVPQYLLWKVPSYWGLLRRRGTQQWVRAER